MRAKNRKKPGAKLKFPWDELAVHGDFVVEGRSVASFSGTLHYANNSRRPKRFISRTVGNNLEVRRVK